LKVDRVGQGDVLDRKGKTARRKKTSQRSVPYEERKSVTFIEELSASYDEREAKKDLQELLDEIDRLGKKLTEEPDVDVASEYRSAVAAFIDKIIRKVYRVREINELRYTRSKVYLLVEKINSELDGLLSMVIRRERDKIAIMSKVTEIRGMLVDLLR